VLFVLGVVLFALGIAVSIALHEAGHMWTAKAFGMRVRRYFIGFGPKVFSFRRGETEYGLKAIPAGGFCDIAGMTALDEVTPRKRPARSSGSPPGSASSCCPPARSRTSSSEWSWSTRSRCRRVCRTCATRRSSAS
jgi:membrane-associated protease RseP (regulator of RpoE activity)